MDIETASPEIQTKWLAQRGWQAHPEKANCFIDPDTRMNCYKPQALKKALANCRLPSDFELTPDLPPRKDDSPWQEVRRRLSGSQPGS